MYSLDEVTWGLHMEPHTPEMFLKSCLSKRDLTPLIRKGHFFLKHRKGHTHTHTHTPTPNNNTHTHTHTHTHTRTHTHTHTHVHTSSHYTLLNFEMCG